MNTASSTRINIIVTVLHPPFWHVFIVFSRATADFASKRLAPPLPVSSVVQRAAKLPCVCVSPSTPGALPLVYPPPGELHPDEPNASSLSETSVRRMSVHASDMLECHEVSSNLEVAPNRALH